MTAKIPLTIIYPGPSLHAVDFFTAIHEHGGFELEVLYCLPAFVTRGDWAAPKMDFRHEYLPARRFSKTNEFSVWNAGLPGRVRRGVRAGRVHLLGGGYSMPSVAMAMLTLNMMGATWYFQSEKPGISSNPLKSALRKVLIRACLGRCTRILAHSQLAVQEYLKLGVPSSRLEFMPYFMNVDEFRRIERDWTGVESRPLRLLYLGQLHEIKGIDWAVAAMEGLADQADRFQLDIVGEGPLRPILERTIAEKHLSNVRLLGAVEWSERWRAFADHDVLLLPSRHDGWGMVVMEALASGMPVLGSLNSGAVHACVSEGKNGWQFPYKDDAALQEAVRKCINSRVSLPTMGQESRESVHDWRPEAGAERLWKLIQSDRQGA